MESRWESYLFKLTNVLNKADSRVWNDSRWKFTVSLTKPTWKTWKHSSPQKPHNTRKNLCHHFWVSLVLLSSIDLCHILDKIQLFSFKSKSSFISDIVTYWHQQYITRFFHLAITVKRFFFYCSQVCICTEYWFINLRFFARLYLAQ